jgi:hypothetical protein
MTPAITRVLRSRWFVGCVHGGLWVLLYLALTNLGGRAFEFHEVDSSVTPPQSSVPVAALERLFAPEAWAKALSAPSARDPFFTTHFIPPQTAPPTTRIIELTYQGFYQTSDGPKQAVYKLGDAFLVAPVGGKIANSLFVADASMQALTLTNDAAQTNIVLLNLKKEIAVPIK